MLTVLQQRDIFFPPFLKFKKLEGALCLCSAVCIKFAFAEPECQCGSKPISLSPAFSQLGLENCGALMAEAFGSPAGRGHSPQPGDRCLGQPCGGAALS